MLYRIFTMKQSITLFSVYAFGRSSSIIKRLSRRTNTLTVYHTSFNFLYPKLGLYIGLGASDELLEIQEFSRHLDVVLQVFLRVKTVLRLV